MAEFSTQGELSITGTVLLTGADTAVLTKLVSLRFNNPAAYTVQLYRYNAATADTYLIYDLNLAAGDTLTDTLMYALNSGDQLIAYSDIAGTTYYAYGIFF